MVPAERVKPGGSNGGRGWSTGLLGSSSRPSAAPAFLVLFQGYTEGEHTFSKCALCSRYSAREFASVTPLIRSVS